MITDPIIQRLTKRKVGLLLGRHPWYATLAMRLTMRSSDNRPEVTTMATDGTHLYYHGPFIDSLTDAELDGVICHEILHCAMGHIWRMGNRDHQRWNIACDYAINPLVIESGLSLPKGVLLNSKYAGMSAEKIYAMLPADSGKPKPKAGTGNGSGSGKPGTGKPQPGTEPGGMGIGGILPAPTAPDADGVEPQTQTDWDIAVVQAERVASAAGRMPGCLSRETRKARESKTDYRQVIRRFLESTVATDYTWARPNRKMLSSGIVLPGIHREGSGEWIIAVDTSGSVGSDMLDQFASEIPALISTYRPSKVHVIYCDTRIGFAQTFDGGEDFQFAPKVSRGGTLFSPVLEWVAEFAPAAKCLMWCTDLEPGDSPDEPAIPVLWLVPETCSVKDWAWGEVVEVAMDR